MYKVVYVVACFLLLIALGYVKTLPARSVGTQKSFNRLVEKHPFVIAMLYNKERRLKKNDRDLYNRIKSAQDAFKQASKMQQYKAADMRFIRANVAEKKLAYVPDSFGVTVQQEPVYILFSRGLPMSNKNGVPVETRGFLDVQAIKSFIDTHLYDAIEDYVDDKMERRAQEKERARSSAYFGIGGYPWYGYYPYHGGWGYPWGYGYGPRVGFGFGVGF